MKIAVLGTGAYGLSLAITLFNNKNDIKMWTKLEHEKIEIETTHQYNRVLPNIMIPKDIEITTNMEECLEDSELIICAIPAAFVDSVCQELKHLIKDNQHICIATKGIEQNSCLFINDIINKHIKTDNIAAISGPSFAIDIVSQMPIGLSLATTNNNTKNIIKQAFKGSNIKLRETDDLYGIEICGAIKNVIAIASGILDGLGANESTKAMFITESIHDIEELIKNLGGNGRTILSYAGFGDLLLTCTSTKSRNFSFGRIIATDNKEDIDNYIKNNTIEGLYTLKSIYKLIKEKNIDMSIVKLIHKIIFENEEAKELLTFLMEKE